MLIAKSRAGDHTIEWASFIHLLFLFSSIRIPTSKAETEGK